MTIIDPMINVRKIRSDVKLPKLATPGSAGADLCSNEDLVLPANGRALFKLGFSIEIPQNLVGLVTPRSGLALKHGVTVANAPGVIDSDYRGEVGVILLNTSDVEYKVFVGDRIAQLLIVPVCSARYVDVEQLSSTSRGAGGYGSTGR